MKDIVIMIPAYNPDDKFIALLDKIKNNNYERIIVINDGSMENCNKFFETAKRNYGCDIVTHSINLGQGRAYKSGFNFYMEKYAKSSIGIIQCDCDGQHSIEDINRCAELLRQNPNKFILGVRNFNDKNVPLRSRFGNKMTSLVFKLFCGMNISDTQTGLKGIPAFLIPELMETVGERFEYASSVLLKVREGGGRNQGIPYPDYIY